MVSVARLIDFAPGLDSQLHGAMSLDYGVVIEGVFELRIARRKPSKDHAPDMGIIIERNEASMKGVFAFSWPMKQERPVSDMQRSDENDTLVKPDSDIPLTTPGSMLTVDI